MQVVMLADAVQAEEFGVSDVNGTLTVIRVDDIVELVRHPDAAACFDLQFEPDAQRMALLKQFSSKPVFINDVLNKKPQDGRFIRFNGWPTFSGRKIIEAACADEPLKQQAEKIISACGKTIEWVPDAPGFISARVVAMIVNEAFFALGEGVSRKEDIDLAMKLGANYPYGPFEWAEKIGLKNIYDLLEELGKNNTRYQPAPFLKQEALASWL